MYIDIYVCMYVHMYIHIYIYVSMYHTMYWYGSTIRTLYVVHLYRLETMYIHIM